MKVPNIVDPQFIDHMPPYFLRTTNVHADILDGACHHIPSTLMSPRPIRTYHPCSIALVIVLLPVFFAFFCCTLLFGARVFAGSLAQASGPHDNLCSIQAAQFATLLYSPTAQQLVDLGRATTGQIRLFRN